MSQATADPTAQEPAATDHQADNAGESGANLDLRELGLPSELMTALPVDTPSRQAMAAQNMLSQQTGNGPEPDQQSNPRTEPQPQNQQAPQNPPPQQGLPINPQGQGQTQQLQQQLPPNPNRADDLANNYRMHAKGDPVKKMAFTLLKENPDLTLIEADSKARERLGMMPTPEETTLEQQIAAIEAEADKATDDMDVSSARKLDKEAALKRGQLEQQRQNRESGARQQAEFEEDEIAAQDRVGTQYPDSFVDGSPMSQTMKAINQAMLNANDPRVNDPRLIEMIAEQAANQLRQQGLQPGWTHYAPATPQQAQAPQPQYQQPVPQGQPTPSYQQQQPAFVPQPQYGGYQQPQYAQQPQYPVPNQQQQPFQPPIASGAAGRQSQASGNDKAFLERLAKVNSGGLDDYDQLVEDYTNGRI